MSDSRGQQGDSSPENPLTERDLGASSKELVPSDSDRTQDVPVHGGGQQGGSSDAWHIAEWDDVFWSLTPSAPVTPDLRRVAP